LGGGTRLQIIDATSATCRRRIERRKRGLEVSPASGRNAIGNPRAHRRGADAGARLVAQFRRAISSMATPSSICERALHQALLIHLARQVGERRARPTAEATRNAMLSASADLPLPMSPPSRTRSAAGGLSVGQVHYIVRCATSISYVALHPW